MLLAIISDIHANLPALDAVLSDAADCQAIVCCGDLVGYYAHPNEVCDRIQSMRIPTIRGNHDAFVIRELAADLTRDNLYRSEWTREQLNDRNTRWLASLPIEMQFKWGEVTLIVRHASPWDETSYLYPDSDRLADIKLKSSEVLALGHSHRPFVVEVGEGWIVNPGSVGQPRGNKKLPTYAVLDTDSLKIQHRSIEYDAAAYRTELEARGWNIKSLDML